MPFPTPGALYSYSHLKLLSNCKLLLSLGKTEVALIAGKFLVHVVDNALHKKCYIKYR